GVSVQTSRLKHYGADVPSDLHCGAAASTCEQFLGNAELFDANGHASGRLRLIPTIMEKGGILRWTGPHLLLRRRDWHESRPPPRVGPSHHKVASPTRPCFSMPRELSHQAHSGPKGHFAYHLFQAF